MTFVGDIETLSPPLQDVLRRRLLPAEQVVFCVAARSTKSRLFEEWLYMEMFDTHSRDWKNGLAALDDRLLFFHLTENTYGQISSEDVTEFKYQEISHIEVDTSRMPVVVLKVDHDSLTLPRRAEAEIRQFAEWLMDRVRSARQPAP